MYLPRMHTLTLLLLAAVTCHRLSTTEAAAVLLCTQCASQGNLPVCAGGTTYINTCYAQCDGQTQLNYGECSATRSGDGSYLNNYLNNYQNNYLNNYPNNYRNNYLNNYPIYYPNSYPIYNRAGIGNAACTCPATSFYQQVCVLGTITLSSSCEAQCQGYTQYQYTLGACSNSYNSPSLFNNRASWYNSYIYQYGNRFGGSFGNQLGNCNSCPRTGSPVCGTDPSSNRRSKYLNYCIASCMGATLIGSNNC